MLKSMRKSKNRYFYHIFVYPGDATCNCFPVIRTASAKTRRFHVPQLTFLFPLGRPLGQSH